MKRNLISAMFGVAMLMGASTASAQIVGGVDFGGLGNHIDTTTVAETLITGTNQILRGYGQVNTVNGNLFYAGTQRLYFEFTYTSTVFTGANAQFSGGVVNLYLGNNVNLLSQSSAANLALIQGMTPWVQLTGHGNLGGGALAASTLNANGVLTGAGINFTGAGLLDVNTSGSFGLASVAAFLNGNSEPDAVGGFADVTFTSSGSNSVLNPNDPTAGCATGTAAPGTWCIAGSADLRGDVEVPEPGSLALVGLSLVALGAASRRKKAA